MKSVPTTLFFFLWNELLLFLGNARDKHAFNKDKFFFPFLFPTLLLSQVSLYFIFMHSQSLVYSTFFQSHHSSSELTHSPAQLYLLAMQFNNYLISLKNFCSFAYFHSCVINLHLWITLNFAFSFHSHFSASQCSWGIIDKEKLCL